MVIDDISALKARLSAIEAASRSISRQLADLHTIAFERGCNGDDRVGGGVAGGVETHGDARAQRLWGQVEGAVVPMSTAIKAVEAAVSNYMSKGPSPEETRGSLIRRAELKGAIRDQRRRAERGEYTPHRVEPQPEYPGAAK